MTISEARALLTKLNNRGCGWQSVEEENKLADVLSHALDVVEAGKEVWNSIPATHDYHDPMVMRHASVLNALNAKLAYFTDEPKEEP